MWQNKQILAALINIIYFIKKLCIFKPRIWIHLWFATSELLLAALEREGVWSTVARVISGQDLGTSPSALQKAGPIQSTLRSTRYQQHNKPVCFLQWLLIRCLVSSLPSPARLSASEDLHKALEYLLWIIEKAQKKITWKFLMTDRNNMTTCKRPIKGGATTTQEKTQGQEFFFVYSCNYNLRNAMGMHQHLHMYFSNYTQLVSKVL